MTDSAKNTAIEKGKTDMENTEKRTRTAIIIGAGPAGLTAAYRLLKDTDIKPVILEASPYIGGRSSAT